MESTGLQDRCGKPEIILTPIRQPVHESGLSKLSDQAGHVRPSGLPLQGGIHSRQGMDKGHPASRNPFTSRMKDGPYALVCREIIQVMNWTAILVAALLAEAYVYVAHMDAQTRRHSLFEAHRRIIKLDGPRGRAWNLIESADGDYWKKIPTRQGTK